SLSGVGFNPRRPRTDQAASGRGLPDPGNPSLHAGTIGCVLGAENFLQPRFVMEHPAMKPDRTNGEQDQRKPRPERDREAGEKDEMAEIHGVAREPIGAEVNDPLWRDLHAGTAARARMPIAADQEILQIAPGHEWRAPGHDGELSFMERKLERDHRQWTQDE